MKAIGIISAVLLLSAVAAGAATATPQPPAPQSDGLVTRVQVDCHADVRRHYLPQYGRQVWHRHRQSNCRVIVVDREDRHDNRRRDCHRDVRNHYLPEYGRRLYHRHVGEHCRVRIYERYDDNRRGRNCVKLGPLTLCEN